MQKKDREPNQKGDSCFSLPNSQTLKLLRFPEYQKNQLRAWDAGDEYLLNHIAEHELVNSASKVVVVNDSFGALGLGLKKQFPSMAIHSVSDSYLAHTGLQKNADLNELDINDIELVDSLACSDKAIISPDLLVIKVPKSLAHLDLQLSKIRPWLSSSTSVIASGMVKNIHSSTLKIFERQIGKTTTSLARKKARLIFCEPEAIQGAPIGAEEFTLEPEESNTPKALTLISYPGVFSHGKLDIGSRFLLENLRVPKGKIDILDLGGGSGVLGLAAALQNPEARATFTDESFLATESAKLGAAKNIQAPQLKSMQFITTHCLQGIADDSQDLILNNPPFHDAAAKTSNIAMDMFRESKRVLRKDGQLWVIANRHLGYHVHLKRLFGSCVTVAGNKKFVILQSTKSS